MKVTVQINDTDDTVWLDRYVVLGREGEVTVYNSTATEVEHMYLPGEFESVNIAP